MTKTEPEAIEAPADPVAGEYRGYEIEAQETRGRIGFKIMRDAQCYGRGFQTVAEARAKIDKIIDQPNPRRAL